MEAKAFPPLSLVSTSIIIIIMISLSSLRWRLNKNYKKNKDDWAVTVAMTYKSES